GVGGWYSWTGAPALEPGLNPRVGPAATSGPHPMLVALTGGTGFVGRHVAAMLVARGHGVRVLARDPARARFLSDPKVELVRGGLADSAALARLARGADALVHLVGLLVEQGSETFAAVHVAGTRAVLAAARDAGVRRFI